MFLVITLLMAVFSFCGLFGGHFSPVTHTALAMLVYVLPLLVIGNIITLVFWLIRRRWHWAAIPAITLLCCIPYVGTIWQTGLFHSSDDSRAGLKVATYNVAAFGRETSGFKAEDILSEMIRQQVDVLCIQEYSDDSGDRKNSESYKEYFTYMATGRDDMVIYSRYPIEQSQIIDFGETNNSGMWADIEVQGKLIRVFNVHMETTGFNRVLRKTGKLQSMGHNVETNALLRAIYNNYTLGMIVRARQADFVAREIMNTKRPHIVCGDFNDVPYSYVYNTILGNMVDGFKECGKGFMYTFTGKKPVRIDYIFHDESLEGESYYKLDRTSSDHYAVFMKLHF
jgi:endonuclease/exonuclease/phosphatase family metal-dependent hydrolase